MKKLINVITIAITLFSYNIPLKSQNMKPGIFDTAHKNHKELWPDYQSGVKATALN